MRFWGIIGVLLCASCAFATPFTFTTVSVERGEFLPSQAEGNGWAFGRAGMVPAWSVLCNVVLACNATSVAGTGAAGTVMPVIFNQPSMPGQVSSPGGNQVSGSEGTTASVASFVAPVSNNANANASGQVVVPGNAGSAPGITGNTPGLGNGIGNGVGIGNNPIRSENDAAQTPEPATFGMFALAGAVLILGRRAFRTAGTRR